MPLNNDWTKNLEKKKKYNGHVVMEREEILCWIKRQRKGSGRKRDDSQESERELVRIAKAP